MLDYTKTMNHYRPRKKHTKRKFFLGTLILVLVGFLAFKFIHTPSVTVIPNEPKPPVATSTPPVIVKPKPKPAHEPFISVNPGPVQQGEPAIITVEGLISTSTVKSFTFDNRPLITFMYDGYVTAFLGVDLYAKTGTFPLLLTLKDGKQVHGTFTVLPRPPVQKPFDIPEKLGGNTPESIRNLITTLAAEGKIINAILTGNEMLWTEKFGSPLKTPLIVDDEYGYTRVITNFTMPHKGTDIVADMGTPVYSMNKGVVRLSTSFRNYGGTVIVDHGLGLQTVYMHLSEMRVADGQIVEKGQLLGLSGDSGYTLNPHLHLTVRIWDISIDPIKFLEIFGEHN